MKVNIVIYSEELTKEDIRLLLQAIRDCEQQHLPQKDIGVAIFVPELTEEAVTVILNSVRPPFKHVPIAFGGGAI